MKKLLSLIWLLSLLGCQPSTPAGVVEASKPAKVATNNVTVSVDQVNYNPDLEIQYSVFDLSSNTPAAAIAGGLVTPMEAGGAKNCCVELPKTWHAGIKIKVQWQEADKEIKPTIYQQTLELPRYEQPGDVYVVFYPDHQVEVLASPVEPGHAKWPGKIKAPPLEACLQKNSKKYCYQGLPKYAPNSPESSMASYRASCQPEKIRKHDDPENTSNWTKDDCMQMREFCLKEVRIDKAMCEINYQEQD